MENKNLTLGSLFDGSGGFPLGGLISGITPLWASEIEPFPIRVTTKRLPQMKHYGDVSAQNGADFRRWTSSPSAVPVRICRWLENAAVWMESVPLSSIRRCGS